MQASIVFTRIWLIREVLVLVSCVMSTFSRLMQELSTRPEVTLVGNRQRLLKFCMIYNKCWMQLAFLERAIHRTMSGVEEFIRALQRGNVSSCLTFFGGVILVVVLAQVSDACIVNILPAHTPYIDSTIDRYF